MIKELLQKIFGVNGKIDTYYSENENAKIEELQEQVNYTNKKLLEVTEIAKQQTEYALMLLDDIDSYEEQLKVKNKHSSLNNFKIFLDAMVPPTIKKYNFRNKGLEQAHLSLSDYTPVLMKKFVDSLEFNYGKYQKVDSLVYDFVRLFHSKYPNNKYYGSDMNNFGVADYWEEPNEAVKRFMDKKSSDCDAHGSALYGALRFMIEDRFPDELWRLRVFIVKTISGEGHYILGFVKEGPNDWIPLETTWYKDSIKRAWTNNLSLRNQIMYTLLFSFDHKYEYIKL